VRLAAAAALICVLGATALAADIVDEKVGYKLALPAGWQATEIPGASDAVLATWTHERDDRMVVVVRINGPTNGAWEGDKAFFDAVENGVKKQYATYERLSLKQTRLGKKKVPALDLWFKTERDGKSVTVGTRFLFMKGYALSIVSDGGNKKAAKKIVESFAPAP
jgi:hypothetical protein